MYGLTKSDEFPWAEHPVPSSVDVLHRPASVSVRTRLRALLRESLVTEFPVNRRSRDAQQCSADEALDLLRAPESPWKKRVWWSPDVIPASERAIRAGKCVNHRYLLSRLNTCSIPCQNISSLRVAESPREDHPTPSAHGDYFPLTQRGDRSTTVSTYRKEKELGQQSCLHNLSVACNDLSVVFGSDLPRSLTSLQLYGNPVVDVTSLFMGPPALQFLGLGKLRLNDSDLRNLTLLLRNGLQSLRVLDICDNDICECNSFVELVTSVHNLRAVTLSGNPAFLASGYYTTLLGNSGRLRTLDGEKMTDQVWASFEQQLHPPLEKPHSSMKVKNNYSTVKKVRQSKKSFRRPAPNLEEIRFEPSLTCALIRITGIFHLPFVPQEKFPGLEVVAVFQWAGERDCVPVFKKMLAPPPKLSKAEDKMTASVEPEEVPDPTHGLCPQEVTITERSDVTVVDVPLEWYCTDLRALRDAMLQNMRVEVVHREKWTPMKQSRGKKKAAEKEDKGEKDVGHTKTDKKINDLKGKGKDRKDREDKSKGEKSKNMKEEKGKDKKNRKGKDKKDRQGKDKKDKRGKKSKTNDESEARAALAEPDRHTEAAASAAGTTVPDDVPPPEFSIGALELPLRALLRPRGPLLLRGGAPTRPGSGVGLAEPTDVHWSQAIDAIQADKKQRKAEERRAAKEAARANRREGKKKKGASVRTQSTRKRSPIPVLPPTEPQIECFFSVELYKKPSLELHSTVEVSSLPIDDIAWVHQENT